MALTIKFEKERTTKNTVVFAGPADAIPTLYVQKAAMERLGNPAALECVIGTPAEFAEAADE